MSTPMGVPWREPGLRIYELVSNENLDVIDNMLRSLGYTGDRYFVDQDVGTDTAETTGRKDDPFDTPDYTWSRVTLNNGDVIYVLPSTSEYDANANAGGIECDQAGTAMIAPGGSSVQVVNSHATANAVMTISASNILISSFYIPEITATVEGIVASGSINSLAIINNILNGAMENGIEFTDVSRSIIKGNVVNGVTSDGIRLAGASTLNRIIDNIINSPGDDGIELGIGSDNNQLVDNVVNGATAIGISIGGDSNVIKGGSASNCGNAIGDGGSNNFWDIRVDNVKSGTFNRIVADDVNENTGDIDNIDLPSSGEHQVIFDVAALETAGEGGTITIRLYQKVDDTNYRIVDKSTYVVGADEVHPSVSGSFEGGDSRLRVSHQTSVAVTANRAILYKIIQKR